MRLPAATKVETKNKTLKGTKPARFKVYRKGQKVTETARMAWKVGDGVKDIHRCVYPT